MTTRTQTHPADTIREATGFVDATHRLIRAIDYEVGLIGDEDGIWAAHQKDARRAKAIYRAAIADAEQRAVAQMRTAGLTEFADALEQGDWELLAF